MTRMLTAAALAATLFVPATALAQNPFTDATRAQLAQIKSPYLGVVLDTVNSLQVSEGYKEVTRLLAPYVISLHAKEFWTERVWTMMGFTVGGRPVGQGQLDVPWLLETLKAAGAEFNVIIELWPPQLATPDESAAQEQAWVRQSVAYLRRYIKD